MLIATSLVAHVPAQTPKGSARIRGRVVAAATGRPLVRATVWIGAVGNQQIRRSVMTDSNGHYEISDLPAGRYSFSASHAGYLEQQFDQPQPLSRYRLLELAAGEQLDSIDFSLHRGSAIVGIIIDEFGDPLPGVRVEVMREIYGINGRRLIPESRTSEPPVTDDEGRITRQRCLEP